MTSRLHRACVTTLALHALAAAGRASAQGPLLDAADSLIERYRVAHGVPAVSVAVVRRGEVIKLRGYGEANVEWHAPATAETVYQSGSVGKQFTSALVMLLVEDGTIALDAPIRRYLPEGPPGWDRLTVRHLLTHTGGLPEYEGTRLVDLRKDYTERQLVQFAANAKPMFAPGAHWSYSNTGYVLLGVIIGRVTGRFYGDVMQERIFRPLGMTTARIISEADIIPNRAAGYEHDSTGMHNQAWVSPSWNTTADGALYFTVRDLVKWDAALRERRLLAPASYKELWRPGHLADGTPTTYGFGWTVDDVRGRAWLHHTGGWQGFTTAVHRHLADSLTVMLLGNLAQLDPGDLAQRIAGVYVPALGTPDQAPPALPGDAATGARTQAALRAAGTPTSTGLNAAFARVSTPQALAFLRRIGSGAPFTPVGCDALPDSITRFGVPVAQLCHYRTSYTKYRRIISVWFDASGAVLDVAVVLTD